MSTRTGSTENDLWRWWWKKREQSPRFQFVHFKFCCIPQGPYYESCRWSCFVSHAILVSQGFPFPFDCMCQLALLLCMLAGVQVFLFNLYPLVYHMFDHYSQMLWMFWHSQSLEFGARKFKSPQDLHRKPNVTSQQHWCLPSRSWLSHLLWGGEHRDGLARWVSGKAPHPDIGRLCVYGYP